MPAPPAGEVGVVYSDTLQVDAGTGTAPFAWSLSAGALPAGLTLVRPTGVISGTPTAAGTSSFTVQVTDGINLTATRVIRITINPAPGPVVSRRRAWRP